MLIASVKAKVERKNLLEFEQTTASLIKEIQKTKDCMGWHISRGIQQEDVFCFETVWGKKEALGKYLRSKQFKILIGAIHNLCDPPVGELRISSTLEEQII